jgi:hypothetical protein
MEVEAIELVNIAVRAKNPIAIEKLNTTRSKVSNAYRNKKDICLVFYRIPTSNNQKLLSGGSSMN